MMRCLKGLDQLFYDLQPLFENATDAWVSWDDKLDSATLTNIVDEQQKLAQGKEHRKNFEAAQQTNLSLTTQNDSE